MIAFMTHMSTMEMLASTVMFVVMPTVMFVMVPTVVFVPMAVAGLGWKTANN
jgi:hypothetical protein